MAAATHPMAFKQPLVSVDPASSYAWEGGVLRRLPWRGLLSIIAALAGIAGWVAIVVTSSNSPTPNWPIQPSVYLAIVVAIVNILVRLAMSDGSTIFWWQRSLQSQTTVGQLHRNWKHANSFWSALKLRRNSSIIAFATIIVTLIPINGPLLQRSTTVALRLLQSEAVLSMDFNSDVPQGFSTIYSGRGHTPTIISSQLYPIVSDFSIRNDIPMIGSGCHGTCDNVKVNGAGFAAKCSHSTAPFNIGSTSGTDENGVPLSTLYATAVFSSNFTFSASTPGQIFVNAQYKDTLGCNGTLQIVNCTLTAANVVYTTTVDGNRSTVSLRAGSSIFDDHVVRLSPVNDDPSARAGANSTLGGVALALQNQYNSIANMRWVTASGIEVISSGQLVNRYLVKNNFTAQNCALAFADPTRDMLLAARELMFRVAVATANGTNRQIITASQTILSPVWIAHYGYLAGAAVLSLASIVAVIPTYNKYWMLGRDVSMSPVELGKAFNAPMFSDIAPNATGKEIVKAYGERSAVYGVTPGQDLRFGNADEVSPPYRRRGF